MKIRCVVACTNAAGSPDFYRMTVTCTRAEYDDGEHYEAAIANAKDAGYEGPSFVAFDENDGPDFLFDHYFP